MEAKLISDLSGVHRVGQILLVSKYKKEGVTEFVLIKHSLKFFPRLRHTLPIIRVDDEDDALGVLEVY